MKVKYNLSLDENLKNKFNEFCKENGLTAYFCGGGCIG